MERQMVYVCFSGEYEQRSATGVFSSKEIAEQYSDDIEEFELGRKLPLSETMHQASGIYPPDGHYEQSMYGYSRSGNWSVKQYHWDSDDYTNREMSGDKVTWWSGQNHKDQRIYVEVRGPNKGIILERFNLLQREVESGRKPSQ